MRKTLVALALIAALLPGCFTIGLGIAGDAADGKKPKPAQVHTDYDSPPPSATPPGSAAAAHEAEDAGMSGAAKGVLIGAVIDVALGVLAMQAIEKADCALFCPENN